LVIATPVWRFVDRPVTLANAIEGYVAIWGDPEHVDAYGTWWDKERPAEIAADFVPYPISYEHTEDGVVRKVIIGKVERITPDAVGYQFQGRLDRSLPFFERVLSEIQAQALKTSSASAGHIAAFYEDNAFKTWWLTELALTKNPAEPLMPPSVW
jgi:hypothetical protein